MSQVVVLNFDRLQHLEPAILQLSHWIALYKAVQENTFHGYLVFTGLHWLIRQRSERLATSIGLSGFYDFTGFEVILTGSLCSVGLTPRGFCDGNTNGTSPRLPE